MASDLDTDSSKHGFKIVNSLPDYPRSLSKSVSLVCRMAPQTIKPVAEKEEIASSKSGAPASVTVTPSKTEKTNKSTNNTSITSTEDNEDSHEDMPDQKKNCNIELEGHNSVKKEKNSVNRTRKHLSENMSTESETGGQEAKVNSQDHEAKVSSEGHKAKVSSEGHKAKVSSEGHEAKVSSEGHEAEVNSEGDEIKVSSEGHEAKVSSEAKVGSGGDEAKVNSEAKVDSEGQEAKVSSEAKVDSEGQETKVSSEAKVDSEGQEAIHKRRSEHTIEENCDLIDKMNLMSIKENSICNEDSSVFEVTEKINDLKISTHKKKGNETSVERGKTTEHWNIVGHTDTAVKVCDCEGEEKSLKVEVTYKTEPQNPKIFEKSKKPVGSKSGVSEGRCECDMTVPLISHGLTGGVATKRADSHGRMIQQQGSINRYTFHNYQQQQQHGGLQLALKKRELDEDEEVFTTKGYRPNNMFRSGTLSSGGTVFERVQSPTVSDSYGLHAHQSHIPSTPEVMVESFQLNMLNGPVSSSSLPPPRHHLNSEGSSINPASPFSEDSSQHSESSYSLSPRYAGEGGMASYIQEGLKAAQSNYTPISSATTTPLRHFPDSTANGYSMQASPAKAESMVPSPAQGQGALYQSPPHTGSNAYNLGKDTQYSSPPYPATTVSDSPSPALSQATSASPPHPGNNCYNVPSPALSQVTSPPHHGNNGYKVPSPALSQVTSPPHPGNNGYNVPSPALSQGSSPPHPGNNGYNVPSPALSQGSSYGCQIQSGTCSLYSPYTDVTSPGSPTAEELELEELLADQYDMIKEYIDKDMKVMEEKKMMMMMRQEEQVEQGNCLASQLQTLPGDIMPGDGLLTTQHNGANTAFSSFQNIQATLAESQSAFLSAKTQPVRGQLPPMSTNQMLPPAPVQPVSSMVAPLAAPPAPGAHDPSASPARVENAPAVSTNSSAPAVSMQPVIFVPATPIRLVQIGPPAKPAKKQPTKILPKPKLNACTGNHQASSSSPSSSQVPGATPPGQVMLQRNHLVLTSQGLQFVPVRQAPVYVQTGQMAVPNKPSPLTNGGSSVFAQPGQNQALVSASAMASRKSRSSFLLAASRILASQKTEVLTKADEDGYNSIHVQSDKDSEKDVSMLQAILERLKHRDLSQEEYLSTLNARTKHGESALFIATKLGLLEVVRVLVEFEADVSLLARDEKSIEERWLSPLHHAAGAGNDFLPILQCLLQSTSKDLNQQNTDGLTPLHCALASHGKKIQGATTDSCTTIDCWPTVLELLDSGADPNAMDNKSRHTPLMYAIETKDVDLVEKFVDNVEKRSNGPALIGQMLHYKQPSGNSVLHIAAQVLIENVSDHLRLLQLLLSRGADPDHRNSDNERPYDVVFKSKEEIVGYLKGQPRKSPAHK